MRQFMVTIVFSGLQQDTCDFRFHAQQQMMGISAQAYSELTAVRPCGPRRDAIRAATYDLLDSRGWQEFQSLPSDAWATLSGDDRKRLQDCLRKQS